MFLRFCFIVFAELPKPIKDKGIVFRVCSCGPVNKRWIVGAVGEGRWASAVTDSWGMGDSILFREALRVTC